MTTRIRAAFGSLLFLLPLATPANAQTVSASPPSTSAVERFMAIARRLPANATTFALGRDLRGPMRGLAEWEPMKLLIDNVYRNSLHVTHARVLELLDAFPPSVAIGCDDATIETLGRATAVIGGLSIAETGRVRGEFDWFDAGMTTLDEALVRGLPMSIVVDVELADAAHGGLIAPAFRDAIAMAVPFGVEVSEHANGQDVVIHVEALLDRTVPAMLRTYRRPLKGGTELDERQQRVAAAMKALRYELRWRIDGTRLVVELGTRGGGELDPAPALGDLWPPSDETHSLLVSDTRRYYDQFVDFDDWLHEDEERYERLSERAGALLAWFGDDFTIYDAVDTYRLDVGQTFRWVWLEHPEDAEIADAHTTAVDLHRAAPRGALAASTFGHMALDEAMYFVAQFARDLGYGALDPAPVGLPSDWWTEPLAKWMEVSEPFDEWIGGEESAVFEPGSVIVVDLVGTETAPIPAFALVGRMTDRATAKTFATEFHDRFATVVGLASPGSKLEDAVVAGLPGWRPSDAPTDAESPLLHHIVLDDLYIASTAPALTARIVHAWRESKDLPAGPEARCQEHRLHGDQFTRLATFVDAIPHLGDDARTLFRSMLQAFGRSIDSIVMTSDHVGASNRVDVVVHPRGK
jgi:hypothetical protein